MSERNSTNILQVIPLVLLAGGMALLIIFTWPEEKSPPDDVPKDPKQGEVDREGNQTSGPDEGPDQVE